MESIKKNLKEIEFFKWNLSKDLVVVVLSWILVVGALYTATVIVGQKPLGGMAYFILYAIIGATLFGIGIPVYWMVFVKKQSVASLGITNKYLALSLVLQLVFSGFLYIGTFGKSNFPEFQTLMPLIALSLAIGFFEAIFWRGWVLQRLENAFGLIPALILGSTLYALYHIGYAMPINEMFFLFFIGLLYGVTFRLTKNIFILWPIFQPMGQLITLIKDQLALPPLAALGFFEVFIVMGVVVWLAEKFHLKKRFSESNG
jgi:uncharacterized protein